MSTCRSHFLASPPPRQPPSCCLVLFMLLFRNHTSSPSSLDSSHESQASPSQHHGRHMVFVGHFLCLGICLPVNFISFKGHVNSLTSAHSFSAVDGAFMERWRWREGECLLAIRYQSIRRRCSQLTCSPRSTHQPPTWIISANHVLFLFPFWPLVWALRRRGTFTLGVMGGFSMWLFMFFLSESTDSLATYPSGMKTLWSDFRGA